MNTNNVTVETITPQRAATLLEKNNANRRLRPRVVERYAADMKAGAWEINGSSIVIDHDGNVIDGQHRLAACVLADKAFSTIVLASNSDGVQDTIDAGAKRVFSDLLHMRGYSNALRLSGAISYAWQWENNLIAHKTVPTHREALVWLDANPEIEEAMRITQSTGKSLYLNFSVLAAIAYHARKQSPEVAELFFSEAARGVDADGNGLPTGHPCLVLRQWALNQAVHRKVSKPSRIIQHAVVLKAWNAYVTGRSVKLLGYKPTTEEFPVMLDLGGNPIEIGS